MSEEEEGDDAPDIGTSTSSTSSVQGTAPKRFKKKRTGTQTVKMRFHPKTDALREWIDKGVDVCSETAIHVSRFSNLYILHCLEHQLPLPQLDKQLFDIMYLVTETQGESFADLQMLRAYKHLYKPLLNRRKPERTSEEYRFLERLTFDMSTNVCTYLRTQFLTRFRQWCTHFISGLVPIDKNAPKSEEKTRKLAQRWKLVSYLFQETVRSDSRVIDCVVVREEARLALAADCADIWNDEVSNQLAEAIVEARKDLSTEIVVEKQKTDEKGNVIRFQEALFCRPVTNGKLKRTDLNYCYLPWLFKRLQQIENHNLNGASGSKQKKLFALMPIRSLDRCYVSISNTALSEWIFRHREEVDDVGQEIYDKAKEMDRAKFFASFAADSLWYWRRCFELDGVLRKHGQIKFEGPITTDGVGCSIAISKPASIAQKKKQKEESDAALITMQDDDRATDGRIKVLSAEELAESDIVGVDPGRKTLYTSGLEQEDGRHRITSYSAGKWRQMSGGNDAMRKRANWAAAVSEEYKDWLTQMPTTKVASVYGMQMHVAHLMQRFDECFASNGKPRVRRLRLTNYIRKQKSLSYMVNEFLEQPRAIGSQKKKLIVAFGDASFKTSGPTRKMKQELRRTKGVTVVDMDEFHTSLITTCCAFCSEEAKAIEREGPVGEKRDEDGNILRKRLYSVTFCNGCSRIWNRDVNAAINMLRVFKYAQANGGARHPFFSRSVSTSTRQKRTASARSAATGASDGGEEKENKKRKVPQQAALHNAEQRQLGNSALEGAARPDTGVLFELVQNTVSR